MILMRVDVETEHWANTDQERCEGQLPSQHDKLFNFIDIDDDDDDETEWKSKQQQ